MKWYLFLTSILLGIFLINNISAVFTDAICSSGTLATTCVLNSSYPATDGEIINGTGNLIIAERGSIYRYQNRTGFVLNFSTITLNSSTSNITGGNITIYANNLTIAKVSLISTNGWGYLVNAGPGRGVTDGYWTASGGGHGGWGGAGSLTNPSYALNIINASIYESSINPHDYGSGGSAVGVGGSGGGIIKLVIKDTLNLSGNLTSNGNSFVSGSGSGGAGGTINVDTYNLIGTGQLFAKGGNGGRGAGTGSDRNGGGGGGGGRIAVYYNISSWTGLINSSVAGGVATYTAGAVGACGNGEAGTFLVYDKTTTNAFIKDGFKFQSLGLGLANETDTPNQTFWNTSSHQVYNFNNLTVFGGASLYLFNNSYNISINYFNVTNYSGFYFGYKYVTNLIFNVSSTNLNENLTNIDFYAWGNTTIQYPFAIRTLNNSDIRLFTNSTLDVVNKFNSTLDLYDLTYGIALNMVSIKLGKEVNINNLNIYNSTIFGGFINLNLSNFTLNNRSYINARALGYGASGGMGTSPASPACSHGTGGSHGGFGGLAEGALAHPYDSVLFPQMPGSGGQRWSCSPGGTAGQGGGMIYLIVNENTIINGSVDVTGGPDTSAGADQRGGGGAGGSIYINTFNLEGNGGINATGGYGKTGSTGGSGGGGGIIAIYYNQSTFNFSRINNSGGQPGWTNGSAGSTIAVDVDDKILYLFENFRFQPLTGRTNESKTPNMTFWNTNDVGLYNFTSVYMTGTNLTNNLTGGKQVELAFTSIFNSSNTLGYKPYVSFYNTFSKITFNNSLNETNNYITSNVIDLFQNRITIDTSIYPYLNKTAILTFYNIPYSNLTWINGRDRCGSICSNVTNISTTFTFNVTGFHRGFTYYSLRASMYPTINHTWFASFNHNFSLATNENVNIGTGILNINGTVGYFNMSANITAHGSNYTCFGTGCQFKQMIGARLKHI